jgi:CopG family nickel-responsive transcriptional regulator
MSNVARISISLDEGLLGQFDRFLESEGYPTRSEAIKDLIHQRLVKQEWQKGKAVAGVFSMVYDHHRRSFLGKLTGIQHDFEHVIVSSLHVHLDHDNCLEVVAMKGKASEIRGLVTRLQSLKGIKHSGLMMSTTGRGLT